MGLKIFQVDAFTDKVFRGNPAGVCILSEPRGDEWMQNLAQEMNLSETAFLQKQDDGFGLRWFTPAVEVDLCGHATLASAHILWETGVLRSQEQARFHTRSGLLTAEHKGAWIELNFPAIQVEPVTAPLGLHEALGVTPRYTGKAASDYFLEVDSEEAVRALNPDFDLLKESGGRGIIVTSQATSAEYDFVSRFFAPAVGINEDPVTGSAHCSLTPFWGKRLGKAELVAYQASRRGGTVRVRTDGERVRLSGQAATVFRGELDSNL
jgi:PhzF family phenazine biosynthesis protein